MVIVFKLESFAGLFKGLIFGLHGVEGVKDNNLQGSKKEVRLLPPPKCQSSNWSNFLKFEVILRRVTIAEISLKIVGKRVKCGTRIHQTNRDKLLSLRLICCTTNNLRDKMLVI